MEVAGAEEPSILHVDMDSFFASVEIRDDPELRGLPVVVGGTGARSVVAAASYPARRYGIRSAMSMGQARRLCPDLVIVPGRMHVYREASREVMAVIGTVCAQIEQISIDEAFCDIRGARRQFGSPAQIGALLRARIRENLELPASVGGSVSRAVAKIASARAKPDGLLIVEAEETASFLAPMSVRAVSGIGPAAAAALERLGVRRIGQLAETPLPALRRAIGPQAEAVVRIARGEDRTGLIHRTRDRSLGVERTYEQDLTDPGDVRRRLTVMADDVARDLRAHQFTARSVSVKLRAPDGTTITRSATFSQPTDSGERLREHVVALWERAAAGMPRVRLAGVRAEQLQARTSAPAQVELAGRTTGWADLEAAMDRARSRFGDATLARGSTMEGSRMPEARERGAGAADDARTAEGEGAPTPAGKGSRDARRREDRDTDGSAPAAPGLF